MVYRVVMYLACFAPLIGVGLMERGAFGGSINEFGYPNGATAAFAFYLLICFGVIFLVTRGAYFFERAVAPVVVPSDFFGLGLRSLLVMLAFLLFTVFVMGGRAVFLGEIGKGAFRVGLGDLGAVGYLILKYYGPAILAFTSLRFSRSQKSLRDKLVLAAIAISLILLAMSWGFKSGGILAVLPALILVFWNGRASKLAAFGLAAACFLVFTYWFFDSRNNFSLGEALEFLLVRLTVLQGDVAWKMWDLHVSGFEFPNYWVTLLPVFGDHVFSFITDITPAEPYQWIMTHFGLLLTYLAGYPMYGILEGHNITGTPFSEGLVCGGVAGTALFGAIAGLAIGGMYLILERALVAGHDKIAATAAAYAVMGVMAWIIGGSILSLFHVSVIFGLLTTMILLHLLDYPFKIKVRDKA